TMIGIVVVMSRDTYDTRGLWFGLVAVLMYVGLHYRIRRRPRAVWLLDSASTHVQKGRVPKDLPSTASLNVCAPLLGWFASRGLTSDSFNHESGEDLERFKRGE